MEMWRTSGRQGQQGRESPIYQQIQKSVTKDKSNARRGFRQAWWLELEETQRTKHCYALLDKVHRTHGKTSICRRVFVELLGNDALLSEFCNVLGGNRTMGLIDSRTTVVRQHWL